VTRINYSTHCGAQVSKQDVLCGALHRWSDAEGFQFCLSQVLPLLPPRLLEHELPRSNNSQTSSPCSLLPRNRSITPLLSAFSSHAQKK
jgi:hypothetical protein